MAIQIYAQWGRTSTAIQKLRPLGRNNQLRPNIHAVFLSFKASVPNRQFKRPGRRIVSFKRPPVNSRQQIILKEEHRFIIINLIYG